MKYQINKKDFDSLAFKFIQSLFNLRSCIASMPDAYAVYNPIVKKIMFTGGVCEGNVVMAVVSAKGYHSLGIFEYDSAGAIIEYLVATANALHKLIGNDIQFEIVE